MIFFFANSYKISHFHITQVTYMATELVILKTQSSQQWKLHKLLYDAKMQNVVSKDKQRR